MKTILQLTLMAMIMGFSSHALGLEEKIPESVDFNKIIDSTSEESQNVKSTLSRIYYQDDDEDQNFVQTEMSSSDPKSQNEKAEAHDDKQKSEIKGLPES